ncbi:PaaI family thioesterase [Microbulbifer sp. 2205BS26-8]|uniref:PaaI family thioesterase n=1 Tax=Microbulbifer sp. 2205BS26-8 TaxID=3064386 RepID=UPI0027402BDD|nr:PaaI family thioesterase [Microbulbifer sp. 2205BS26-8]MDP5211047.1 PaaI family thioesterase [Microbulbifer sp. 2205BS26-8]
MNNDDHFRKLEAMYGTAPINEFYAPTMAVSEGKAVIEIDLGERFYHAAGAVHGSVYFKMLDDAAFFATSSLEITFFVLTISFTTYLTRPVSEGKMQAVGKVVNRNKSQFIAESIVYDSNDKEIGRGNGMFIRSKRKLSETPGYGV